MNWIECEFTAIRYFTLDGSDYPNHTAQQATIAGYIRWRNRHCHPQAPLRGQLQDPLGVRDTFTRLVTRAVDNVPDDLAPDLPVSRR